MKIELDIKDPSNNTNEDHGNISLEMDRRYAYIKCRNNTIVVDADELYRAVSALYK